MTRPSHPFTYDPLTPSRIQEPISVRFEDKLGVSLTYLASKAEAARRVETDVRRGCSDSLERSIPPPTEDEAKAAA